ncbi:SMP-30/gluconolactonase/LRE family protein [Telmatocola sphagniphila]|uniref:SMP-30/gluconolactonase/LRE family protein n=1 Tax=Telmatocola sphagniphila TaxID=1123043 RepID=A0A8E6EVG8_9BACT|nr:SMP-30/gluconolactonase/LRE family protein [Telmatocola sphagniphila]QVL32587.1 SMP-30/gluconolactonase/LRE family protein [Telmatocola sphagniphila]
MLEIRDAKPFVKPIISEQGFLPEGPSRLVVDGRPALSWVNIQTGVDALRGEIHLFFWDTHERRILTQAGRPGFALPIGPQNTMVCGMDKTVGIVDLSQNSWMPLTTIPDTSPFTIINDALLSDCQTKLYFGTKDVRFLEPIGHLYEYDLVANHLTTLIDRQTCSNGKIIRKRSRGIELLDIDTPTRKVVRYEIEDSKIVGQSVALDLKEAAGFPDGMTSANDQSVIISFYNPEPADHGLTVEYDLRTATALKMWKTPGAPRATCPVLMERDGQRELYITTCSEGGGEKAGINAGVIFWATYDTSRV